MVPKFKIIRVVSFSGKGRSLVNEYYEEMNSEKKAFLDISCLNDKMTLESGKIFKNRNGSLFENINIESRNCKLLELD